jgi:mannose-1-phosphate guanylyltransferase/mannose-6-phosphate isomerase
MHTKLAHISPFLYRRAVKGRNMLMSHVVALILAGGSGTRLWPYSRQLFPKQFMKLEGDRSMLQVTADRLQPVIAPDNVWVITGTSHAAGAGYQELQSFRYMVEPCARNTAPAIGMMAALMADKHDDPIMAILAADHAIADVPAFQNALQTAVQAAEEGHIVTFGIKPVRPETGYGYIQAEPIDAGKAWAPVARFVEKPNRDVAQVMLDDGHYYWNSGMFVAKAGTMLEELKTHAPAVFTVLQTMRQAWGAEDAQTVVNRLFETMPNDSIDYAVMEKSRRVVVVPCDIGWSDVGSWDAVYDMLGKDENANVLKAKTVAVESHGNMVMGDGRLVALVGVNNLCVIDTPDALLVADRARAQDVKKVVETLKTQSAPEHILHRTVHRPWGNSTVLETDAGFKIKRVEVLPGGSLSLQVHQRRSEHWVVVAGTATVMQDGNVQTLHAGQSTFIAPGVPHKLENRGTDPVQIVEIQVGDYLEEDDITRLD